MILSIQMVSRESSPLDWPSVRRVLLIRLRSIGDTILMTPCLAALKSWRPDLDIAVLSESLSAPVLEDHPLVDKLLIAGRTFSERARLTLQMRRMRFDAAFNMHGGTTATILARLSGARYQVGYGDYNLSRMLNRRAPSPDVILNRASMHSVEQQLALLHWSGMPWLDEWPRLILQTDPQNETLARERLARLGIKSGFAAIAPAAALESKRWPAHKFSEVIDHLSLQWDLPSVIFAGPGQERVADEAATGSRAKPVVVTGVSLKELIALLGLASIYVGNDSGPMHIAAALDRPVVAVFGSSNAEVWHPWTDSAYRIVRADRNEKKSQEGGAGSEDRYRIEAITVEEMIAAVDDVMEAIIAV